MDENAFVHSASWNCRSSRRFLSYPSGMADPHAVRVLCRKLCVQVRKDY